MEIDINCDMGESYGQFKVGNDALIFPHITTCNIACGFHGGDPLHIEKTIKMALDHEVQIGAHPSYPDLLGFGRRPMILSAEELKAVIKYQVSALKGMVESVGGKLVHVKPHGALYNSMVDNQTKATAVIEAVREVDDQLALMGLSGSPIKKLAEENGLKFIREAFADRQYTSLARLQSREEDGAVITDPDQAVKQVMDLIMHGRVIANNDAEVSLDVDSICIHGDNPAAVEILKAINEMAKENNIAIKACCI